MELIKKFRFVIAIVLPILILVLIRSTGLSHFKNDAKRWAEPSVRHSNTITKDQIGILTGKNLVINLDNDTSRLRGIGSEVQNISPDSVLCKKYFKRLMKYDGPVVLYSSDPGISAKIWMILSQMGRRNIFILTTNADNEVLKYKFQPDSLSGPAN